MARATFKSGRGVSSNRISIDGRGSREPVAANDTAHIDQSVVV